MGKPVQLSDYGYKTGCDIKTRKFYLSNNLTKLIGFSHPQLAKDFYKEHLCQKK